MRTRKTGWNRSQFLLVTGIAAAGLAILAIGASVALGQEKPDYLVIGTQGGDMGKYTRKHIDEFFQEKYDVRVMHFTSKHPQRLVKLKAEVPNPSFHVNFSKANYLTQAANMGLLQPLGPEIIPNINEVFEKFRTPHFVGQMFTAEGVLYNPDAVKKPNSWAALWDPKYRGKVAVSRFIGRTIMMCSLYATGGKELKNEEKAWEALEVLVQDQKAKYISSSEILGTMFEQGEVVMAPYWLARSYQWKMAGIPVEFSSPKEGAIAEFWGYCIPRGVKGATKKYAGEWIARAISAEAGQGFAKDFYYSSCNRKTKYPPELASLLLAKEEFDALKTPDYLWIAKNIEAWTERFNKLLSR